MAGVPGYHVQILWEDVGGRRKKHTNAQACKRSKDASGQPSGRAQIPGLKHTKRAK